MWRKWFAALLLPTLFVVSPQLLWVPNIKGPGNENRISCKILNVKYFPRLSENMNVLLYFVWDIHCLRKQRDQVNRCPFTLLKSSGFFYVITMHSDNIENCRGSMISFFIAQRGMRRSPLLQFLYLQTVYFSEEKIQPPSYHSTEVWVPWYQV